MTTDWQIFDTKYQTADGLITEVTYGCTATLENFIDRAVGTLELTGDSSLDNFIPYYELTQENILTWVKASLGVEAVAAMEATLQNNIIAQKQVIETQTIKRGLPWRD